MTALRVAFSPASNPAFSPVMSAVANALRVTYQLPQADATSGLYDLALHTDARLTTINLPDHEGIIREIPAGVMSLEAGRVVQNLQLKSNDPSIWVAAGTTPPALDINGDKIEITIPAGVNSYAVCRADTTGLQVRPTKDGQWIWRASVTLSRPLILSEKILFYVAGISKSSMWFTASFSPTTMTVVTRTQTGSTDVIANGWLRFVVTPVNQLSTPITLSVKDIQMTDITGMANTNPPEYVINADDASADDGFAYYNRLNGNTVDANGVVTEAPGALISPTPFWRHAPESTNVQPHTDISFWSDYGDAPTVTSGQLDIKSEMSAVTLEDTDPTRRSGKQTAISGTLPGGDVAIKFFAKEGTSAGFGILVYGSIDGKLAEGDFTWAGGVPSASGWTVELSSNGFYQITKTVTLTVTQGMTLYLTASNLADSSLGSTTFCYPQVEEGSFSTPIIETSGAAVTRDAVQMQHLISTYFDETQGSMYMRFKMNLNQVDLATTLQLLSVDNTANSVAYVGTSGSIGSLDSASSSATETVALAKDTVIEIGVLWGGNSFEIGHTSGGGAWSYGTPATFSDFALVGSYIELLLDSEALVELQACEIADNASKTWLEAH